MRCALGKKAIAFLAFVASIAAYCVGIAGTILTRGVSTGNSASSSLQNDCDQSVSMKVALSPQFCTSERKALIAEECYLIIHSSQEAVRPCTWKGCGIFSVVGQPAKIEGNNFVEYGIATPHMGAPYDTVTSGVLPQRPFPRQYMKLGNALKAIDAKCVGMSLPTDVSEKLCGIPDSSLSLSPYLNCLRLPINTRP